MSENIQQELIDGYVRRVQYLRIFVPYFDAKFGYKISKWKHLESFYRRMLLKDADDYLLTLNPDTVLWAAQERLIDRYYAYVFPPTTFLVNMTLIRKYFLGFEKANGYDVVGWKKLSETKLRSELKSISRNLLSEAVEKIALYYVLKSKPTKDANLKGLNKEQRMMMLQAAGLDDYGDIFKIALMPVSHEDNILEIKDVQGIIGIKENNVWQFPIKFDVNNLINNPLDEIRNAFNKLPKRYKYTSIALVTVERKIVFKVGADSGAAWVNNIESLMNRVLHFTNRYNGSSNGVDSPMNHIFTEWLWGIVAFKSNNKKDLDSYKKLMERENKLIKEQRNKEKQKQKRVRSIAERNGEDKKMVRAKKVINKVNKKGVKKILNKKPVKKVVKKVLNKKPVNKVNKKGVKKILNKKPVKKVVKKVLNKKPVNKVNKTSKVNKNVKTKSKSKNNKRR